MVLLSSADHVDVCQILKSRLRSLKEIRAEWSVSDPKVSGLPL